MDFYLIRTQMNFGLDQPNQGFVFQKCLELGETVNV